MLCLEEPADAKPDADQTEGPGENISLQQAADLWVGLNGCAGKPVGGLLDAEDDAAVVETSLHDDRAGGSAVNIYCGLGGGHT